MNIYELYIVHHKFDLRFIFFILQTKNNIY